MSLRSRVAILVIPLLAALDHAVAQVPQLSESIDVSIVNVDVFVTDKQGNRVRGLTKDDFEIRERGRVQPITNFAEYGPTESPAAKAEVLPAQPTAQPASNGAKRTIVVFVEFFRLPPFHAKPIFDGMRQMLRQTVRPGDAVTIVSWANVTHTRLDFTDNLAAIEKAISAIEAESTGIEARQGHVLWAQREEAVVRAWDASLADAAAARGMTGPSRIKGAMLLGDAKLEFFKLKQKAAAIRSLMEAIAPEDGRKVVIMATHRFGLYAGAELFGGDVPPEFHAELDTRELRESIVRTASANNITLYPVYPAGLGWTPSGADETWDQWQQRGGPGSDQKVLLNETASLTELAHRTGGAMAWGSTDFVKLFPRIAADLESYYSLAYRTPSQRKDEERKIVVVAKNPAYVVRARRQYVDKSDATKMTDRVTAGLFRVIDRGGIGITAEVGTPKKTGRNRWSAPLRIRVPISSLTMLPGAEGMSGAFSVFVGTGSAIGVAGEVVQRTQSFTIATKDLEKAKRSHYTYNFELNLDEVTSRVSVGVFDEVSREYGLNVASLPQRDQQTAK